MGRISVIDLYIKVQDGFGRWQVMVCYDKREQVFNTLKVINITVCYDKGKTEVITLEEWGFDINVIVEVYNNKRVRWYRVTKRVYQGVIMGEEREERRFRRI